MSEWIARRRASADSPRRRCQDCAGLSSPAVKKATRCEQGEGAAYDALQPGLGQPEVVAHHRGLLVVELAQLGLQPRRHRHRLGALGRGMRGDLAGTSPSPSSTLATNSTGLAVSGESSAARRARRRGPARSGRACPACSASISSSQPLRLGDRAAVAAARSTRHAVEPALGLLEVGEDQLGLDRLDVGQRVDAALGVDDVLVAVRADDMDDCVGLADVGQELVAQPLAAVRARHESGDVVEVDRVGDDLRGADDLGHGVQPVVLRPARWRRWARSW